MLPVWLASVPAAAAGVEPVVLPDATRAVASRVVSFDPGTGLPEGAVDPDRALGAPDGASVPLGRGGSVVLGLGAAELADQDELGRGVDLWIWLDGRSQERVRVDARAEGAAGWVDLGWHDPVERGPLIGVDLSLLPAGSDGAGEELREVRIRSGDRLGDGHHRVGLGVAVDAIACVPAGASGEGPCPAPELDAAFVACERGQVELSWRDPVARSGYTILSGGEVLDELPGGVDHWVGLDVPPSGELWYELRTACEGDRSVSVIVRAEDPCAPRISRPDGLREFVPGPGTVDRDLKAREALLGPPGSSSVSLGHRTTVLGKEQGSVAVSFEGRCISEGGTISGEGSGGTDGVDLWIEEYATPGGDPAESFEVWVGEDLPGGDIAWLTVGTFDPVEDGRDGVVPIDIALASGWADHAGPGVCFRHVLVRDAGSRLSEAGHAGADIASVTALAWPDRTCHPAVSPPDCGHVLTFEASAEFARASGGLAIGQVHCILTNDVPVRDVKGWSFGVRAEGAAIVDLALDPVDVGPFMTDGFHRSFLIGDGAVSAVVLGLVESRALPPAGAHRLANLTVEIEASDAPAPVTLSYDGDLSASDLGRPLSVLVDRCGFSCDPEVEPRTIVPRVVDLRFIRGDTNGDGFADISDSIYGLSHLFLGGPGPDCDDAADVNDDGAIDISDMIYALSFLFLGGRPPPAPGGGACGVDPTEDTLGCVEYRGCEG